MEIVREREIKKRDHGLPSDTSVIQRTVLCDKCNMGFFVNFPSKVDPREITAFLNRRYPEQRGPCYHPAFETVEIFNRDIRPSGINRFDPTLYQRNGSRGRFPNQPR